MSGVKVGLGKVYKMPPAQDSHFVNCTVLHIGITEYVQSVLMVHVFHTPWLIEQETAQDCGPESDHWQADPWRFVSTGL